ncbi:plastocyanin [Rhodoligotrophos appendicifer]|uniref:copper-binding protein n=1 Tax=Rhodoligotrophos appendicifer TaxID=987056 RepID=UPI0011850541|nr:copper-binding protein [Rhodoligotrophos appendicifer]
MKSLVLGSLALFAVSTPCALAEGYLAAKAIELGDLILGTDDLGFGVSHQNYDIETGKSYSLTISSSGKQECAWIAPEFFNFVWLRKVEAGEVEIKATHLYELEFEEEGEASIFFVPIRPGTFEWSCRGLESRGMKGTFTVK